MPYSLLYNELPALAENETRSVIVQFDMKNSPPADAYAFCEMFCDEPGCDCRRVFFTVISEKRQAVVAVIAYGWETPEFYAKWMGSEDPVDIAEMIGPVLNFGSKQSQFAPMILELFMSHLLMDIDYIKRVKRHYKLFRQRIERKAKKR